MPRVLTGAPLHPGSSANPGHHSQEKDQEPAQRGYNQSRSNTGVTTKERTSSTTKTQNEVAQRRERTTSTQNTESKTIKPRPEIKPRQVGRHFTNRNDHQGPTIAGHVEPAMVGAETQWTESNASENINVKKEAEHFTENTSTEGEGHHQDDVSVNKLRSCAAQ